MAEITGQYPDVCLVQHHTNHGYGAALKTGFAQARGDWMGFLDADGTYPPEHFPALLDAAHEQAADLVAQIDAGRLQHLVAVHISDTNNTRELAVDSLAAALDVCRDEIEAACQNEGLGWREVV